MPRARRVASRHASGRTRSKRCHIIPAPSRAGADQAPVIPDRDLPDRDAVPCRRPAYQATPLTKSEFVARMPCRQPFGAQVDRIVHAIPSGIAGPLHLARAAARAQSAFHWTIVRTSPFTLDLTSSCRLACDTIVSGSVRTAGCRHASKSGIAAVDSRTDLLAWTFP